MKTDAKRLCISMIMALILTLSFSLCTFAAQCGEIRDNFLRLHVIANSNSDADQKLKLEVRDAMLEKGADLFDGSITAHAARVKIEPNIYSLEHRAREVIKENGFDYDVSITVKDEYFPTRTYESVTLPAGVYTAVKVNIGSASGQNWWCVMFPPLCLPAAQDSADVDAVLDDGSVKVVESNPRYEPRFKIVEVYEKVYQYFNK